MLVASITCAVLVQTKFIKRFLLLHSSGFTGKRQTRINIMSVFGNGLYLRGPGLPPVRSQTQCELKVYFST